MNPENFFGIEFGFRVVHRFAQKMRVFADVKFDIISGGFDPVNVGSFDKINAPRRNRDLFSEPFQNVYEPACVCPTAKVLRRYCFRSRLYPVSSHRRAGNCPVRTADRSGESSGRLRQS